MREPGYKPLEAYGLIGNLETCALVGRDGSIDWCCLPHLESSSVFCGLLDDERGGHYTVSPIGRFESQQRYRPDTAVLETEFSTASGTAVVTDFMPLLSDDPSAPYTEPWIYRKATCTEGDVELAVEVEPRFDYARGRTIVEPTDDGVIARGSGEHLSITADTPLEVGTGGARGDVELEAGETAWTSLQYGLRTRPSSVAPAELLSRTVTFWEEWVHQCHHPDHCLIAGPWHDTITRSAVTLKLLMHRSTGAIAAAPTTSLPESIGGSRNWDYRFSWIRDAAFTVQAFYKLGHVSEARDFFDWCLDLTHHESGTSYPLQPLYGLHGETEIDEEVLDHLSGYRGSAPVRIGNAARDQLQLDIFGEFILALYETSRYGATISEPGWQRICELAEGVCALWNRPDTGIWEVRSEPEHFVHSKVMCWAALDRAIAMARDRETDHPVERWADVRASIRSAVLERGYDEALGSFVRSFDAETALDAATLQIPLVGFLPFDDDRVQGTIDAVKDRLTTDRGLVYRYRDDDGVSGEEGTFLLCTCWLVDCLALSGRTDEAEAVFETLLDCANPLGLFAEEVDPETGELRGNFPQAFSHLGVINSALYLRVAKGEPELLEPRALGLDRRWRGG